MTAQRYCVTYQRTNTGATVHCKWARSYRELIGVLARMTLWDDQVTCIEVHDTKLDFSFFRRDHE